MTNAVAAVFGAPDSHVSRALVKTMLDRMAARGAGHRTVVAEGAAVLAAAGRSPAFSNKPERAMLAGDLRLANRTELRAELGLPADAADAVIALEAFCRWGVESGRHLAGPFALVIFDRSESRLIVTTDPLGIRPLYYRRGSAHLRVASELQALVEEGDAADEGFLAEALAGTIVDREGTPFASIRRIPAAHALIADADGLKVQRYWEPPGDLMPEAADVEHEFERLLHEAVATCCDGQAVVGVHLDGSAHSASLVAAVEALESTEPVRVSTPAADPPAHDLGSIHRWLDLPDLPTGLPSLRMMCEPLKERGVTVLLSTLGGDMWPSSEPDEPRGWTAGVGQMPRRMRQLLKSFMPGVVPEWIDVRFAKRVGLADRLAGESAPADHAARTWDRLTVETGIDVRHPFCDRRLVELAFASASQGMTGAGPRAIAETAPAAPAEDLLVQSLRTQDADALLSFFRLTELGWIRPEPLARLREQALAGRHDAALTLWHVLGVEAWLQQAVAGAAGSTE